jgi:hypothetical protein
VVTGTVPHLAAKNVAGTVWRISLVLTTISAVDNPPG